MSDDDDGAFASQADRSRALRQHFAAAIAAVLDSNDTSEAAARPPASTSFAAQLTEVAWTWTTTALAPDLESFARHAKRTKIGVEDVMLAARKNDVTHALIEREAARLRSANKRKASEPAGA